MASHLENYVDPDQLATDRAIGSGLTLFSTILENHAYYYLNIFFGGGYCFLFIKCFILLLIYLFIFLLFTFYWFYSIINLHKNVGHNT